MPGRDLGEYRKQHSLVWEEHSGWREMQIQCPEVCRIMNRLKKQKARMAGIEPVQMPINT